MDKAGESSSWNVTKTFMTWSTTPWRYEDTDKGNDRSSGNENVYILKYWMFFYLRRGIGNGKKGAMLECMLRRKEDCLR